MAGLRGTLHDPLISVVMPAYDEQATIEEIVGRVLAVFGGGEQGKETNARVSASMLSRI